MVVPYTQESAQLAAESKSKVSKLSLETEVESRISTVESQIADQSLISQNDGKPDAYKEKKRPRARFELSMPLYWFFGYTLTLTFRLTSPSPTE